MSAHDDAPPPVAPGSDYAVGYGKPPVATRFQPGQSGNPRGRPRGARSKAAFGTRRADDIVRAELYRLVTIRENGKTIKLPALAAMVRGSIVAGMKGSRLHTKQNLDVVRSIEGRESAELEALFEVALDNKQLWQKQVDQHAALGLPKPTPLVPHPDDVIVDPRRGTVEFDGPTTDLEQTKLEQVLRHRDQLIHAYQTAEALLVDDPDRGSEQEVQELRLQIDSINAQLPSRHRRVP